MLSISRDVGPEPHGTAWVPRPRVVPDRPQAWARPAHPADAAQARMFDSLLAAEIAELEGLVGAIERRWRQRCERGIDDENRPPESLVRMRGRVLEAQQLLDALRARFPSD